MRDKLSIVISAYNEEGNIEKLYKQIKKATKDLALKSTEIIFVDDGSKDKTLFKCYELQKKDSNIKIVKLLRNFGHEIAMTAGMNHAKGDAVIFMDADLQHPPQYIADMVKLWQKGNDIVLTQRKNNLDTDWTYQFFGKMFYKFLNFLSDTKIPANTPDFRLLDRKYITYLQEFNERDSLFRGVLSLVSNYDNVAVINFVAPKRYSGESKYDMIKSMKLAINSILQFSVKPLYLSLWLAIISGLSATGLAIYVIIERMVLKNPTPGYATIVAVVGFMGSMNLFILAIIGAYIGKIHIESKKRPLYMAEYYEVDKKTKRVKKDASKDN